MDYSKMKEDLTYLEIIVNLFHQDKLNMMTKYKNTMNSLIKKYTQEGMIYLDESGMVK